MNTCLKIGDRRLDGDEIIAALVRYKLLEPLIGQILLDDAIKDITLSKQELFRVLSEGSHRDTSENGMPEDFSSFLQQWCEAKGVTAEYFQAVVLRELQVQKFKQLNFADQVVSEFLKTKPELDQVEYSLLQVGDLLLAQELYFLLRDDGADFAQLVEQYSIEPEFDHSSTAIASTAIDGQRAQGWIGPVPLSTLPTKVATLFRQGQPGFIYGPISVADRFWIVRLERLILAQLTEVTWLQLMNRLFDRWLTTQVRSFLSTPNTVAVDRFEN